MEFMNPELFYEFRAKKYAHRFRSYADDAVKEIKRQVGNEPGIQVSIKEEDRLKGVFSVSMTVNGMGEPVFVRKAGRNVIQLIKKTKKLLLSRLRQFKNDNFNQNEIRKTKELIAS